MITRISGIETQRCYTSNDFKAKPAMLYLASVFRGLNETIYAPDWMPAPGAALNVVTSKCGGGVQVCCLTRAGGWGENRIVGCQTRRVERIPGVVLCSFHGRLTALTIPSGLALYHPRSAGLGNLGPDVAWYYNSASVEISDGPSGPEDTPTTLLNFTGGEDGEHFCYEFEATNQYVPNSLAKRGGG